MYSLMNGNAEREDMKMINQIHIGQIITEKFVVTKIVRLSIFPTATME